MLTDLKFHGKVIPGSQIITHVLMTYFIYSSAMHLLKTFEQTVHKIIELLTDCIYLVTFYLLSLSKNHF